MRFLVSQLTSPRRRTAGWAATRNSSCMKKTREGAEAHTAACGLYAYGRYELHIQTCWKALVFPHVLTLLPKNLKSFNTFCRRGASMSDIKTSSSTRSIDLALANKGIHSSTLTRSARTAGSADKRAQLNARRLSLRRLTPCKAQSPKRWSVRPNLK